ncbi:MAG TPA: isoamylase [Polyangiaceae bacterium]|nr:isoamylase [Polyangiaceae bacterium]
MKPHRAFAFRPALACALVFSFACALPSCSETGEPDGGASQGENFQVESGATAAATALPFDLGGRFNDAKTEVTFRVRSERATRIEVWVYNAAKGEAERARYVLQSEGGGRWSARVPLAELRQKGVAGTVFYGYRAWGPNWAYNAAWQPGSSAGFVADVNGQGDRFNPNKLLFDPYGFELSHDPINPTNADGTVYGTGPTHRLKDSGRVAPKSIVLDAVGGDVGVKPTRALKDDVIYEVHVRGLTRNDATVPVAERGTYAGAARKAAYLKSIGVTAVEFLPLQETDNDANDVVASTAGDNYWGYMTLNYFSPDRRYAADKSPGGPSREFRAMVKAFHDQGLKVYADVVYNHTAEGGTWDGTGQTTSLFSMRGLDNAHYYELGSNPAFYYDNTGIGANFNSTTDIAVDLIVDSLRYWKDALGLDGFRFDLASVLGNRCFAGCFEFDKFDPNNALNRSVVELPSRPAAGGAGVDLIAEPWAIGSGTYRVGDFPAGWAEWNGAYRDVLRRDQNELGVSAVTPGQLATRFAGSSDLYADDGRKPWHSINFVVAHDGFTLRDLYSYNAKNNLQPWPFGPSDGGEDHNVSWDQGGDPALQRQAARNALALVLLSAGVPMITGGDEMYRTQFGNNNSYNLDSDKNWLDWSAATTNANFLSYARRLMLFRSAHPALRPANFWTGAVGASGLKDITWLTDGGVEASGAYMDNANNHFLAFRLDGARAADSAASIYVAYNGWSGQVNATLPAPRAGKAWYRVGDTATWMESQGNFTNPGQEQILNGNTYGLAGRSLLLLIER